MSSAGIGADEGTGYSLGAVPEPGQLERAVWGFPLEKANVHCVWKRAKFVASTTAGVLWVGQSGFGLTWNS